MRRDWGTGRAKWLCRGGLFRDAILTAASSSGDVLTRHRRMARDGTHCSRSGARAAEMTFVTASRAMGQRPWGVLKTSAAESGAPSSSPTSR